MGNSKRSVGCQLPAAAAATSDTPSTPSTPSTPATYPVPGANGILAQVQGHHVAAALQTLPRAMANAPNHHEVLVEAGHLGTVRLFIVKKLARHNRHSHYYWSAYRAEPA